MSLGFPETWVCWGIPGVREIDGTYGRVSLCDLPSIEAPDDLSWLSPFDQRVVAKMDAKRLPGSEPLAPFFERNESAEDKPPSDLEDQLALIRAQATRDGIQLPKSFVEIFQSSRMQGRFFNPTGCEFDLSAQGMTPDPFGLNGRLLRFMNDQQWCVNWYLFIPPNGGAVVLSASETEVAMALEEHDPTNPNHVTAARAATSLSAHSFPEFAYRFWVEATLWFKRRYGVELSPQEASYFARM